MNAKHFTYTIYYNQYNWYKLLHETAELTNSLPDNINYYLKLDTLRGPHINITLLEEEEKVLGDTLAFFSEKLSGFVSENPSPNKGLASKNHYLFQNFDNNSIHYGIHDYHYTGIFESAIHQRVAELIILIYQGYSKDTFDMKTEVIIQILALYSLALGWDAPMTKDQFEGMLNLERKKYSPLLVAELEENALTNFNTNKTELLAYHDRIQCNTEPFGSELDWEENWISLVKDTQKFNTGITRFELLRLLFNNMGYRDIVMELAMYIYMSECRC